MPATFLGHAQHPEQSQGMVAMQPGSSPPHGDGSFHLSSSQDEPMTSKRPDRNTPKSRNQTFDYVWRSGVAGGLAGCAAKTAVAPLDRVKILFQASNPDFAKYSGSWFGAVRAMRDIFQQDGVQGLFRGHSATLLRIFPYAGIKFLAYEQIRAIIIKGRDQETPFRRLISGALAGTTSVFFCYPLDLVRVRLAFETKRDSRSSLRDICRKIYNEVPSGGKSSTSAVPTGGSVLNAVDSAASTVAAVTPKTGLANFYRGFTPTLCGMLPYAGMSFLTHDTAGDLLRLPSIAKYTTIPDKQGLAKPDVDRPAQLKVWAELTAGGLAGLVSQTISYPFEVIRRRMQVGGAVGDRHRLKMAETMSRIWVERGFRGFFVGLGIGYFKVVPMAAISFFVYERSKYWLGI